MPRGRSKVTGGVRNIFDFDVNSNVSTCKMCQWKVPSNHLSNLKHHLRSKHRDFFDSMESNDDVEHQQNTATPCKKRKIQVEYDPVDVESAWLDLVVKEGRPFTLLDSESLRKLLMPVFNALEISMLTSHNVHMAINERSHLVVENIKQDLGKKIFSLKIDSATRHTRRIICINAQAVIKGKIKVYTLAMAEMGIGDNRHTAKNIKLFVLYVLNRYGFSIKQIYSITQDNGKNFILAARMLSYIHFQVRDLPELEDIPADLQMPDESENESVTIAIETSKHRRNEDPNDSELSQDYTVENLINDDNSDEESTEDDEMEYIDEDEDYARIEQESVDEVNGLEVLKCAAHTLALAVTDTMKKLLLKRRMKKLRQLGKFLRTPIECTKLKKQKLSLPKMDVKIRWNSSYDLILSLMKLRAYCETEEIDLVDESDWEFAEKFLKVFKPVKVATKKLQAEQLTLSDFFKIWTDVTLRLEKMKVKEPMAIELHKNILKREADLFVDNKPLQAALYLDPRFRQVFHKIKPNYFDEKVAQTHLLDTYKQLKRLQPQLLTPTQDQSQSSVSNASSIVELSSDHADDDDGKELLESYVQFMFDEVEETPPDIDEDEVAAWGIITSYTDRQPLQTNVLDYWYNKRFSNPLLYKLACIVLGAPASQVTVERCFSVLKFILNDYRGRLDQDILENIMLIRLNK